MHLILTGATGLVGSAALDAMIRMKDVSKISILTRRPIKMLEGVTDPRINVIQHQNFEKYDAETLQKLQGASGCVWALGISQTEVGPEEYVKITKDMTLAATQAFQTLPASPSQPFRFIYVSGEGATQSPGMFTPIFGRVKGETEAALSQLRTPSFLAESVRPAFVDCTSHEAIKPFVPRLPFIKRAFLGTVGPVIRTTIKWSVSPTHPLGQFLVEMAMGKKEGQLEKMAKDAGSGVTLLEGGGRIINNQAFRTMAGL